ncbi:ribbon-helix-helix protein, CopG family [Micromonospora zhanjiangensis]|uniref:Ribbon-helix-helix protein, CopG family n=1 Tax=Micromonospora zhanjiangensis TaxID=1522057 RepID=A0ABV8KH78_9ACTN
MSTPDFEQMTKDEIIAWFRTTENLSPALAGMEPAVEPAPRATPEAPMMLASIRLPVALVEQLDELAERQGTRRSDVVREALLGYVAARTGPVGQDEAEHALDVLRRLVAGRTDGHAEAA